MAKASEQMVDMENLDDAIVGAAIIALGDRGVVQMAELLSQDSTNGFGMKGTSDEFKARVKAQLLATDEFKTRLHAGAVAAGIRTSFGALVGNALRSVAPYVVALVVGWLLGARSSSSSAGPGGTGKAPAAPGQ
jgi:hypothetical protein